MSQFHTFGRSVRYRNGLPVLSSFAVLGAMARMLLGLESDFEKFVRDAHADFGPLVYLYMGSSSGNGLLLCEGPAGFEVLKSKTSSMAPNRRNGQHTVGVSMLAQDDHVHHRMRSAMNAPFIPRGLASHKIGEMTADLVAARVASFVERRDIDVLRETQELALDIIFRILGIERTELDTWRHKYQDYLRFRLPGLPAYRADRAREWLDGRFRRLIDQAKHSEQAQGLIGAFARGEDESGKGLSERELIDNLLLLAVAGHETTASTMAWMTFTLARRPDLFHALCAEASRAESIPTTPQALRDFPFAEALFRETLRMYPPVFIASRETTEWIKLHGHPIPPGTTVGVELGLLAKDPTIFPEPLRFDPARWIGRDSPPSPIEISPFGGGPHFCLGYHLAVLEGTQYAVGLAQAMQKRGLYPRLGDGPGPRKRFVPLQSPRPGTRVEFIAGPKTSASPANAALLE